MNKTIVDVNVAKIEEAARRIQSVVSKTAIKTSMYLQNVTGIKTYLKLECLNISGSFKIRGATNALLQSEPEDLKNGVTAASAGNHAQGVAHVCRQLNVKATIFMPERTPLVKIESTRGLGGEVRLIGQTYDDAYAEAVKFQKESGAILVHPFADPKIICGQGTIGLEILEQIHDLGAVIVPIGGGGLISGIACFIKETNPKIRIIGVQTEAYPAVKKSLERGQIVKTPTAYTIADGIAVKQPGELNFALIQKYVDEVVLVDEDTIAASLMDLLERDHVVAEGCGAVPVAALMNISDSLRRTVGNRAVACIITGGNIDINLLRRITTKGLLHSGRLTRLSVMIEDRPGKLAELLNIVSKSGGNLLEVYHNRVFNETHFDKVEVSLDVETINRDHQERLAQALTSASMSFTMAEAARTTRRI